MHVQCSICTEAFEGDSDISAVNCGHTFHRACLERWLATSNTCPQCRKSCGGRTGVISKLFFDKIEHCETTEDHGQLKNALDNAKVLVKEREKALNQVREQLVRTEQKTADLSDILKEEQSTSKSLRKQLAYFQEQQKSAEAARKEAKLARQQMSMMKDVETLIGGCEQDVEEIIQRYGGESTVPMKQLGTYCVILKRELESKKTEKKQFKSQFNQLRLGMLSKENDCEKLRKKVAELQKDLNSLMSRSMTQKTPLKPKRFNSTSGIPNLTNSQSDNRPYFKDDSIIDLDSTAPLPAEQKRPRLPSDETSEKKCETKRTKRDEDVEIPSLYQNFKILQKPGSSKSSSSSTSVSRDGYNGLGSHSTFLNVQPGSFLNKGKKTAKKVVKGQPNLMNFLRNK